MNNDSNLSNLQKMIPKRAETAPIPEWVSAELSQRLLWLDNLKAESYTSIVSPVGVNTTIIQHNFSLLENFPELSISEKAEDFLNAKSWPTLTQFVEAIANPGNCFSNPQLKGSISAKSKLGFPLSWAGQFAVVFQLKNNNTRWAIRCFSSRISDQSERYAALNAAIQSAKGLDCFAGYEFIDKGILVAEDWYPIIRMDWVEGQTLDMDIEQKCKAQNGRGIAELCAEWRSLASNLNQHHIAHGDLQHENILVNNGKIRLVDYDGVYVPALKGRKANELGLSHYQHPKRSGSDFNENIDHFSILVIYLSLLAISKDLTLWKAYHTDKHLIFRDKDYQDPNQSTLFNKLSHSPDDTVKFLSNRLSKACSESINNLPNLEAILAAAEPNRPREGSVKAPDWLQQLESAQHPQTKKPRIPEQRSENSPVPDYLKNLKK